MTAAFAMTVQHLVKIKMHKTFKTFKTRFYNVSTHVFKPRH